MGALVDQQINKYSSIILEISCSSSCLPFVEVGWPVVSPLYGYVCYYLQSIGSCGNLFLFYLITKFFPPILLNPGNFPPYTIIPPYTLQKTKGQGHEHVCHTGMPVRNGNLGTDRTTTTKAASVRKQLGTKNSKSNEDRGGWKRLSDEGVKKLRAAPHP